MLAVIARRTSTLVRMASTFRYTLDNPKLSLEQREFYEKNGYILIKNSISHEILDECA